MANLQLISNITGWFDVRIYNDRIPRENWKLKGDDDQIAFTATFDASSKEAVQFAAHGKPYTDNNGNQRVRVTFKIGVRCRWFDDAAQSVQRPSNAYLDGKKFEVSIQYNELDSDPNNPKKPRGYWVDAIQYRESVTNPFTSMEGAATPVVPPQPKHPNGAIPQMFGDDNGDNLPY